MQKLGTHLLPAPNASALPGRAISINNTTKTNAVVGLLLNVPIAMISDDVRISTEDTEENESRKGEGKRNYKDWHVAVCVQLLVI